LCRAFTSDSLADNALAIRLLGGAQSAFQLWTTGYYSSPKVAG